MSQAPITSRLSTKKAAGWYHIVLFRSRRGRLIECDALIQTDGYSGFIPEADARGLLPK